MEETNLFELATKKKFRFETSRGSMSVEDLWDMQLSARDGFDLDSVAKACSKKVKETEEESFVKPVTSSNADLKLKLDVVKHIISVKLKEKEERENKAVKDAKKAKILAAIERKQDEELEGKSLDDLKKELAEL